MSVAMPSPPTAAASESPPQASTNEQLSAWVLAACDSDRFWEAGQDPFWTPPRTASATRTHRKHARDKPPSQHSQQQSSTGFRHHADTQQYILRYRANAVPQIRGLSAHGEGHVDAVSPPPVEIDPDDLVPAPAVSTAYIPDRRLSLRSTSIPPLSTHSAATFERLNHIANGGGRSEKARRKKNTDIKHMSMMTPETTAGSRNGGRDGAAAELWRQYDDYDASDVPSVPATRTQTGQNDPALCPGSVSAAAPGGSQRPPPVSRPVVRAIGNAHGLESPGKLQVRSVGLRRKTKNPTAGDGRLGTTKNGKPPLAPISMLTRSSWQRRDSVAEGAKTTPMQANSLIQTFRIGMRPDRGLTPPMPASPKRGGGREDPPYKRDDGKRDTLPKIGRPSSSASGVGERIKGSPTAKKTAAQLTPRGRKRRMLLYGGDVTDATVERLTSRMMSTLQMIQDKALPADSKRNSPSHQRQTSKSKPPFGVPGQFSHTSRHTDALSGVLSTDRMTKRSSKARQRDPFSFKRR